MHKTILNLHYSYNKLPNVQMNNNNKQHIKGNDKTILNLSNL